MRRISSIPKSTRRSIAIPLQQRQELLRPTKKTFREQVKSFIWDKEKKTCMTRSPLNWFTITVYYACFLSGIGLIFYGSMKIAQLCSSSSSIRPQYVLDDSPIGSSPSLNFFPLRHSKNLIWLSGNRSFSDYVDIINRKFEQYKKKSKNFNPAEFGACAKPPFGYDSKTPCIFFKLNRLLMWKPTPYKKGDVFPDKMPETVKKLISESEIGRVWLSCSGTTAKDRDHISEDFFELQGSKGLNISVYPFKRQNDFVDPIVALMLKDSKQQKVLYSFTCIAWSNGLDIDKSKVDVSYYFE